MAAELWGSRPPKSASTTFPPQPVRLAASDEYLWLPIPVRTYLHRSTNVRDPSVRGYSARKELPVGGYMHQRHLRVGLITAFALATELAASTLPSSALAADNGVAVTELGGPSASARSAAAAVNRHGRVVGLVTTGLNPMRPESSAATWTSNGRYRPIGGTVGEAHAINRHNQAVGHVHVGDHMHAVLWSGNDRADDLGTLSGGDWSTATAINDREVVVGYAETSNGTHAFAWHKRTGMTDLGTLGSGYSYAYDVNSTGQIVGSANGKAVVWDAGRGPRELAGGGSGIAYAINDGGVIVGEVSSRPVVWPSGAPAQSLPTPSGNAFGHARDINASGDIVGSVQVTDAATTVPESHAVVWRNGTMCDLNHLLPSGSAWRLGAATGISDGGHIVGSGTHHGAARGFMLTLPRNGQLDCS